MRRYFGNMKIKQKGFMLFVLFIITPILIVGWIGSKQAKKAIQEQVGQTLFQLVKQNHFNLEQMLSNVDQSTVSIIEEPRLQNGIGYHSINDVQRVRSYIQLQNLLSKYSVDRDLPYSIFIPNRVRDLYYFAPGHDVARSGVFYFHPDSPPEWVDDSVNNKGAGTLQIISRFGYNPGQESTVAYTRSIRSIYDANLTIGVLFVSELEKLLGIHMQSIELPDQSLSLLLNERHEVLYTNGNMPIGTAAALPPQVAEQDQGVEEAAVDGSDWLYAFHYSPEYNTKLIYQVPVQSVTGQITAIQRVIHIMTAVYLAIIGLFIVYLAKSILEPLVLLTRQTGSYVPGQPLTAIAKLNRKDEIGLLYQAFYRMTIRLNHLVKEKYEMEIRQKETELMILHSQITPHLLYNTLDSIYWTGIKGGVPDVAHLVKDLAMLLRIGLSRGKSVIAVSEELQHAEAYTRLQLKRYNNSFDVYWEVDEEIKPYYIPKVILQPLIENAILHGIGKMDKEGKLWIVARRAGHNLEIRIEDNGFKKVDVHRINSLLANDDETELGLGIRNVHQRIRLHYGRNYGLTYTERPAGGTAAIICLPAVTDPSERSLEDVPNTGS